MKNYYDEQPNGYLETIRKGLSGVRSFRGGFSFGRGNHSDNIARLKHEIETADAVVIGAGAGMSTSAGLTYSGERFDRYFSDFKAKFGIQDMYSGGFFPFPDEETRWAWWARHIYYNRYIDAPKPVYRDLLSLVKMDRNAESLDTELCNINELIERILKMVRPIAQGNDVELTLESTREINAEVDKTKFSLAIMNLVENAVKYNKTGGWVKVRLDADHQLFTVEVEDSGVGIPKDSLDHIFERFYRVDKSHSREIGGTGLGLSIARSAILLHRGAIKAESKEGEGTVFTVRVPIKSTIGT